MGGGPRGVSRTSNHQVLMAVGVKGVGERARNSVQRRPTTRGQCEGAGRDGSPHSRGQREGAYFITICTRNRECLLGDVGEGRMHLNEAGLFAQAAWEDLPRHYPHVALDAWTIMPNHVHGIVVLTERVKAPPEGSGLKPDPTNANAVRHGLPEVVRAFKTLLQGESTSFAAPLALRSGNATTMNTSSGTRNP